MGSSNVLAGKEAACDVGDTGSIPGSGRSSEGGNGNPLQYSCLKKNLTDRGAWWARVQRAADLDRTKRARMTRGSGHM